MYKKKYYKGDKTICARYIVVTKLGPEFVTDRLYLNMDDTAKKSLNKTKKYPTEI